MPCKPAHQIFTLRPVLNGFQHICCWAAQWADARHKENVSDPRLLHVLEYVKEHLADDLSLEILAKEVALTPFQFVTLFQRVMEKSPHKHVMYLRMENARNLLCQRKRTIAEIALLCGFSTASHFGVAFRKQFGKSPAEYRLKQRSSELRLNMTRWEQG